MATVPFFAVPAILSSKLSTQDRIRSFFENWNRIIAVMKPASVAFTLLGAYNAVKATSPIGLIVLALATLSVFAVIPLTVVAQAPQLARLKQIQAGLLKDSASTRADKETDQLIRKWSGLYTLKALCGFVAVGLAASELALA
ncbi:hypothetical protein JCM8097_004146 [Rhodosporidiobolus ruineniae]